MYDLQELYAGRHTKFDLFWAKAKEFLEEDIRTAVDDRRHTQVVHLAKAVSVRDFRDQVVPNYLMILLFHLTHISNCNCNLCQLEKTKKFQRGTQGL